MDLTTTIAGPHCGRLLIDVGAKVIEIEPLDGELLRDRMSWHLLRSEYQAFQWPPR
jgi:crotonobetainyl-CoA:carnitine CoA-transferase CaiB-like acyl-CoA transferase